MPSAPYLEEELARRASLRVLPPLLKESRAALDDLVRIASTLLHTPMAVVTLLDGDKQHLVARRGLDAASTPRDVAFCAFTILEHDVLVIPDTLQDSRFADNALVVGEPRIRFYAGAPIRLPNGHALGALCVLDRAPRALDAEGRDALSALRRQVEQTFALHIQHAEVRRAHEELTALQRGKDALAQFIVHDMRNSLASISASAHLLRRRADDPQRVRALALNVQDSSAALSTLAADLLDLGRVERGAELRVSRIPLDVDDVLRGVAEAFEPRLQRTGNCLSFQASGISVDADPDLLSRALANLVDNAIKHSPAGGAVAMRVERVDGEAVVWVTDRGAGVPPELRERIFEMYVHGHERRQGSHGLGLAFCRLVAAAHRGRVWVEDNPGGGSAFAFALPAPVGASKEANAITGSRG